MLSIYISSWLSDKQYFKLRYVKYGWYEENQQQQQQQKQRYEL